MAPDTDSSTSSPAAASMEEPQTQSEQPKRPLMPNKLLLAAVVGCNNSDLKQLLGLNEERDHTQVNVPIEDLAPLEPSFDCLTSATGMGNTVLHTLCANGLEELVSAVCNKDASLLKARNVRNETPFHHAARFGYANTISRLIENARIKFGEAGLRQLLGQRNCSGETALHDAARYGHEDAVIALLEADMELASQVNNDFVSPLYLATARGSLDVVQKIVQKLMIAQEITPDFYSGPNQQTALHAAVLQQLELAKELLKLYSEPLGKQADDTGRTPLHLAASIGNHNMAKLLLDKDRSLAYIQDLDGSFPVHVAVRMGHVRVIALLLERCLDSGELLDHNGKNFLHIAIEGKKADIIFKLLKGSNNKIPNFYWEKVLNRMGNTMDNKGNTPLHLAAELAYIGAMFSLLENNELDLRLQNKEGLTACDLSVIQLRKFSRKNKGSDGLSEFFYNIMNAARFGTQARFVTDWFEYYVKGQMPKTELRDTIQDHNVKMDERCAEKSSDSAQNKAQVVGLGSVLIATVTFAAAFTLPGGTNQDNGTPILGRKYFFKAFVLADFSAFFLSFLSTLMLIYNSTDDNSDRIERNLAVAMNIFTIAAKCMVMALVLSLHVVIAPIGSSIVIFLFLFSLVLIFYDNPRYLQHFMVFKLEQRLLKHIPDGVYIARQTSVKTVKEILYFFYLIYIPIFVPFIFVFLVALL